MKSILITGGSGFFGQGFVHRLLSMPEPQRICVLSRGEFAQAAMRLALNDDGRLRWFIGDVRDVRRLESAMSDVDVVIHAAALKRVEVGEYNPLEMVRTNVDGAVNVIEAAIRCGVRHVVALSSDKACEPLNCYGATKLVAEKLFLAANGTVRQWPTFAVARYGNVAGSTGSIVPVWRHLKDSGARLQMTDPEATRFWMTLDQAIDTVLYSIGRKDITVPKLKAYRLGDLAEAMDISDRVDVVGLRSGEKRHETMMSAQEASMFGLEGAMTSDAAERMSVGELREALQHV